MRAWARCSADRPISGGRKEAIVAGFPGTRPKTKAQWIALLGVLLYMVGTIAYIIIVQFFRE
jgi:hypothetical protein